MKLLLTAILLVATNAFAGQQLILTTTSDIDSEQAKFYVETDSNNDFVKLVQVVYVDGKVDRRKAFTADQAESGIVLAEKKGRNVVTLTARNFSEANGGNATLSYLRNGIKGSYGSMEIDIRRDGDVWGIYVEGTKVKGFKFIARRVRFIGVVGVYQIQSLR